MCQIEPSHEPSVVFGNSYLQNILDPHSSSLLQNCVWTLSNFVRGKPKVNIDAITFAIPVLTELIKI